MGTGAKKAPTTTRKTAKPRKRKCLPKSLGNIRHYFSNLQIPKEYDLDTHTQGMRKRKLELVVEDPVWWSRKDPRRPRLMKLSESDVEFDSMALSHSTLGAKSLVWVEHGHGQLLGGSTGLDLMQNIMGNGWISRGNLTKTGPNV